MSKPTALSSAVAAALDFFDAELWQAFANADCFAVKVPGEPHGLIVTVLGDGGDEFGLGLQRGPRALDDWMEQWEDDAGPDVWASADLWSCTRIGLDEAFDDVREAVAALRPRTRFAPCFLAKEPHRQPRELSSAELEHVTMVLRGVLKAVECELIEPMDPFETPGTLLELRLSGDPVAPDVETSIVEYPIDVELPATPAVAPPASLSALRPGDDRWLVGLSAFPGGIEGDDRAIYGLVIMEMDSCLVLKADVVLGFDVEKAAGLLYAACEGQGGLPRQIVFSSLELFEATVDAFESVRVSPELVSRIPQIEHFIRGYAESIGAGELWDTSDHEPDVSDGEASVDTPIPESDDEAGWLMAERALRQTFPAISVGSGAITKKAKRRYFGANRGAEVQAAESIATEWFVMHYRARDGEPTLAEDLLEAALPEAVRRLILARLEAVPSFYRVEDVNAESVTLSDWYLGTVERVADPDYFQSLAAGVLVIGSIVAIGSVRFFSPLTCPVDPDAADEALAFLRKRGLSLSRHGLQAKPHLTGRLWQWQAERAVPREAENRPGHRRERDSGGEQEMLFEE